MNSGRAEHSLACAINRAAGGRPIPGNRVSLLIDGDESYRAMLDAVARAERWIHFENYIFRSDAVGWRFAKALAERARAGVEVRVLYDWLGSIATSRALWRHLRDAGAEVRVFHPPRPLDLVTNLSRNHRKLVVADGARAILGGLCIGCEWTGETAVNERQGQRWWNGRPGRVGGRDARPTDGQPANGLAWRDTAVDITGPAAVVLDEAFARTWEVAGGAIPEGEMAGEVPPRGDAGVRVIMGEPGRERTLRVIELLAAGSIERLWITDAYLVAPRRLFQVLVDAARDGVDVRLLVPGTSDLPFIRDLSRIGYRDLLRHGVRIWEWDGPMLHAKTIVADDRWVRIGSSNLNPSSLIGNYELDVLVEDAELAGAMEAQFRRDIARAREVARRPRWGPRRISQVLPPVLTWQAPEVMSPHPPRRYRHTRRELRHRATLALRTIADNARRSVFAPISAIFLVLGLLFVALPKITAYVFAALCAWLALGAGREAFRRRGGTGRAPGPRGG